MLYPVELFFWLIKNRIRAFIQIKTIWFNNYEGRMEIFNALWIWKKLRMLIQYIKNAKQSIFGLYKF